MTRSLFVGLSLVGLLTSISGCDESDCSPHLEQYDHVQRVFMHTPGNYSLLLSPEGQSREVRQVNLPWGNQKLFQDVLLGNDIWAKKYRVCEKYGDRIQGVWISEIHLHSTQEIGGGGWNHGKHGHGQTVVVE